MRIFLVLLSAFIFSTSHADKKTIRYGVLVPLSGDYAKLGEEHKRGINLALKDNSTPNNSLDLLYGDSQATPKTAVTEFKRLTENEGAQAILLVRSPVGMAVNPLSKLKKIPIFGGVGHPQFVPQNEYAFQFWTPSNEEGAFIANDILRKGYKNIAMFTSQDEWTISVSNGFRDSLKDKPITIVYDQEILTTDTDFRSIISKMRSSKADTLFVNVGLAQIGPILKQLREQQIDLPRYSTFFCAKKEVIDAAEGSAEGVKFAEMKSNFPKFYTANIEKYNEAPSAATFSSYAATMFLLQAMNEPNTALYDALLSQKSIKLPDIELPIVERRVKFPLVLREIKDGKAKDIN